MSAGMRGAAVPAASRPGIWPVRVEAEQSGLRLAQTLGGELYRPWQQDESQKAQFQRTFEHHSQWVLIMATGIATRFVEGLLRDKHHDPAVVVLDEAARYAIALLGGHEGGANALAYEVARTVGAIPVVTTATEATKPLVVGVGCRKGVSAEQIERAVRQALVQWALTEPGGVSQVGAASEAAGDSQDGGAPNVAADESCVAGASNIGAGGSCIRGAVEPSSQSPAADPLNLIRELATVDLKANEPGLLAFSQKFGIPLRIIAKRQIEARPWVSRPSEWVRQSVGLDGVCEPCALIASTRGRLVVPKTILDGVAVAIVEDRS